MVRELSEAELLGRPAVVGAVDALLAEGRAAAEARLYAMVREHGLPDPVWNVELRLPGGPRLGAVDAYWPDHAVAVELDARAPRYGVLAPHARRRRTRSGPRTPRSGSNWNGSASRSSTSPRASCARRRTSRRRWCGRR